MQSIKNSFFHTTGIKCLIAQVINALTLATLACSVAVAHASGPVKTTKDWSRKALQVNPLELGEALVSQWQGGQWQAGDMRGYYRFIITRAGAERNRLYVQWWQNQNSADVLAYSVSVRELNEYSNYSIALPACVDSSCQSVTIKTFNPDEEVEQQFLLNLSGLGEYRLSL